MTDAARSYEDEVVEVASATGGTIAVLGTGTLAQRLRDRLHAGPADAPDSPDTIVVATDDAADLARALEDVADLGSVVLAACPAARPHALDLYTDLHVRGITLVGLPGPSPDVPAGGAG